MELDMDNARALNDNVIIEITEEKEEKVGGIYIPQSAQGKGDRGWRGVVHRIGKDCEEDFKIGDEVIFDMSCATNFNDLCVVCPEEHIFAKIKD